MMVKYYVPHTLNRDYVSVPYSYLSKTGYKGVKPLDWFLYAYLKNCIDRAPMVDEKGYYTLIGRSELADVFKCSSDTISKNLKIAIDLGLLEKQTTRNGGKYKIRLIDIE